MAREEEWIKVAWEIEQQSVQQMTHKLSVPFGDKWNKVRKTLHMTGLE